MLVLLVFMLFLIINLHALLEYLIESISLTRLDNKHLKSMLDHPKQSKCLAFENINTISTLLAFTCT